MKLSIWWKMFLWASGITGLLVVGLIGFVAYEMGWERAHRTSVEAYKEDQFDTSRHSPVKDILGTLPSAESEQTALVLEAQIAESDIPLLQKKGYNIIALDTLTLPYTLILPASPTGKGKLKVIEGVWNFNFEQIPPLQVVMARFYFPFFPANNVNSMFNGVPQTFKGSNYFWEGIDEKLQPGGYFVGNFLDPATTIFHDQNPKDMTFHTKDQVLALFDGYEILKLEEVKQTTPAGFEHRYEVFARKK